METVRDHRAALLDELARAGSGSAKRGDVSNYQLISDVCGGIRIAGNRNGTATAHREGARPPPANQEAGKLSLACVERRISAKIEAGDVAGGISRDHSEHRSGARGLGVGAGECVMS